MASTLSAEIDAWLRAGQPVVTASDRAARAIATAFHRARLAEGLTAWPAPNVQDWKSFVRDAWKQLAFEDERLLLNPTQESALWVEIAGANHHMATLLAAPRHRIAGLAMEAHELLCWYAPKFLSQAMRSTWQHDAATFSGWLAAFDEHCYAKKLLAPSRLPLELLTALEIDSASRPPLLLAGFDRILPTQRSFFDAWGEWREVAVGETAARIDYVEAPDAQTELAACALWCHQQLEMNPHTRLLVVTQQANERRGEIERMFLKFAGRDDANAAPLFEFSLGIPLGQVALARAALLQLRWLTEPLQEHEIDWLFSSGFAAGDARESAALQAAMRALRRRNLERTQWTLDALIGQRSIANLLPAQWVERMKAAQRLLDGVAHRALSPLEWAALLPRLLETAGWPGARALSSAEHQAAQRWQLAVEAAGSLGFDGRHMRWMEFFSVLTQALNETLFASESHDAPIQIAGPAESAGLTADAVWFMGADENRWPASGATHPLLPNELQREFGMPHATAQLDWELAQSMTTRLLASSPEIRFSYARQSKTAEVRPSRLIAQLAGAPQELPTKLKASRGQSPQTIFFEDFSRISFAPGKAEGGSSVLTAQSQCPFKAFARARLNAQSWKAAEAGLTAAQRGQLLHAVLHAIWSGAPDGIRSLDELVHLPDRKAFVASHVQRVLRDEIRAGVREQMPRRYLELEAERLTRLVTEWLDYEATRIDFVVAETEAKRVIDLAGLTLELRLDRVDRLNDGSLLVIDYKTGDVSPKDWELPRPNDVQLPLYAGFALEDDLGGLVFAKVRAGDHCFAGRVGDAKATLLTNLSGNSALVRNPFTVEQLLDWRDCIEQLAHDFLAGKAEVNPREYPKTCEFCDLKALCRIEENQPQPEENEDADGGTDE